MLRAIKRTIEQSEIRTISVDIFDTVLLRTLHPESARFHRIAQAWHDVLKHGNITVEELVDIRAEVTLALRAVDEDRGGDGETTITHIIDGVIYLLESRHHLTVSSTERHTLLSALIEAELRTEEAMLKPHRALQKLLQNAKERGARIYFLSDMYLSGDQIRRLLRHYNCDALFDDGITSSDIGMNKGTGRAYRKMILEKGFGDIDLATHLHIGDHTYCDVMVPQTLGIHALTFRAEGHYVRQTIGKMRGAFVTIRKVLKRRKVARMYQKAMKHAQSAYTQKERIAFAIGTRLAPGVATYISRLVLYARKSAQTIHFLSREAVLLSSILQNADAHAPSVIIPDINRYLVLCATLNDVLRVPLRDHDERLSRFIIDRFDDKNFPSFLRSLEIADDESALMARVLRFTKYTNSDNDRPIIIDALRTEYAKNEKMRGILLAKHNDLLRLLSTHTLMTKKHVLIADVGWLGSMQFLLEILYEKQGIDTTIQGLYLGTKASESGADLAPRHARGVLFSPRHPALTGLILTECLWEYALETNNPDATQQSMCSGLLAGIDFLNKNPSIAPRTLFTATLPALIRFMNLPTTAEVREIGSRPFDLGLGMKGEQAILSSTTEETLRFRPRRTLRRTKDQLWQTGFLVQHRLYGALLVRFMLQLTRAWRSR